MQKVRAGKHVFMQLIQDFNYQVKHLYRREASNNLRLLRCAEFWWLHKGTIPASTIAILLKVKRTDLINLLNAQIIERGTYTR
jgi:hypothetical protein